MNNKTIKEATVIQSSMYTQKTKSFPRKLKNIPWIAHDFFSSSIVKIIPTRYTDLKVGIQMYNSIIPQNKIYF
jgi:hypothetical protein